MQGFFFNPPLTDNYWGHIFAELYKEKVYAPLIEGKNLKVCLEIGANVGLVSYYFSQHFEKVIALEPAEEHFEILSHMIAYNKLTNIIPVKKALFFEEGQFQFHHNKNKTMHSLHTAVADGSSPPEMVQTITLPKIFEEYGLDKVDFMKLDCEGSEVEILSSLSFKEVADKIDSLLIEQHQWNGRHPNQIKEALKNNGFIVKQLENDADLIVATKYA